MDAHQYIHIHAYPYVYAYVHVHVHMHVHILLSEPLIIDHSKDAQKSKEPTR